MILKWDSFAKIVIVLACLARDLDGGTKATQVAGSASDVKSAKAGAGAVNIPMVVLGVLVGLVVCGLAIAGVTVVLRKYKRENAEDISEHSEAENLPKEKASQAKANTNSVMPDTRDLEASKGSDLPVINDNNFGTQPGALSDRSNAISVQGSNDFQTQLFVENASAISTTSEFSQVSKEDSSDISGVTKISAVQGTFNVPIRHHEAPKNCNDLSASVVGTNAKVDDKIDDKQADDSTLNIVELSESEERLLVSNSKDSVPPDPANSQPVTGIREKLGPSTLNLIRNMVENMKTAVSDLVDYQTFLREETCDLETDQNHAAMSNESSKHDHNSDSESSNISNESTSLQNPKEKRHTIYHENKFAEMKTVASSSNWIAKSASVGDDGREATKGCQIAGQIFKTPSSTPLRPKISIIKNSQMSKIDPVLVQLISATKMGSPDTGVTMKTWKDVEAKESEIANMTKLQAQSANPNKPGSDSESNSDSELNIAGFSATTEYRAALADGRFLPVTEYSNDRLVASLANKRNGNPPDSKWDKSKNKPMIPNGGKIHDLKSSTKTQLSNMKPIHALDSCSRTDDSKGVQNEFNCLKTVTQKKDLPCERLSNKLKSFEICLDKTQANDALGRKLNDGLISNNTAEESKHGSDETLLKIHSLQSPNPEIPNLFVDFNKLNTNVDDQQNYKITNLDAPSFKNNTAQILTFGNNTAMGAQRCNSDHLESKTLSTLKPEPDLQKPPTLVGQNIKTEDSGTSAIHKSSTEQTFVTSYERRLMASPTPNIGSLKASNEMQPAANPAPRFGSSRSISGEVISTKFYNSQDSSPKSSSLEIPSSTNTGAQTHSQCASGALQIDSDSDSGDDSNDEEKSFGTPCAVPPRSEISDCNDLLSNVSNPDQEAHAHNVARTQKPSRYSSYSTQSRSRRAAKQVVKN